MKRSRATRALLPSLSAAARSAAALLLVACAPAARDGSTAGRVELFPVDAEVWSFRVVVSGSVTGRGPASTCELLADARRVPLVLNGERFKSELPLAPGKNHVVARCVDAQGRELRSESRTYTVLARDEPRALIEVKPQGAGVVLDASKSAVSAFSHAKIAEFAWRRVATASARSAGEDPVAGAAHGVRLEVPARERDAELFYELRVKDALGHTDSAQVWLHARGGRVLPAEPKRESALRDRVVYGVLPPLFGAPPLQAVRRRLPELAELGVGALWLSPIFATPPGDFGYAVTDYTRVRSDYGSADDLRALVADAHGLGLRVLLDLVPNHTSSQHRYFQQAEALTTASHYYDFYARDTAGRATHYFDWEHLPNLAYGNEEVASWMTTVSARWLRDFGVDGYRVDAAWGIRERSPLFYMGWVSELRRARADAVLIAEASALDPYYVNAGFDAAYDWTTELGHWAWEHVFDAPGHIAERLERAIRQNLSGSPHPERTLRFLNNNDTGPRFVTRHGVPLTRLATVLLLTLPGVPCLYSFDEIGAEFEPYAGLKPPSGPTHPELLPLHRRLVQLRNELPVLRGSGFLALPALADGDVYAYLRLAKHDASFALVLLNFSAHPRVFSAELPEVLVHHPPVRGHDALSPERRVSFERELRVELPAFGYSVLVPD